MFTDYDVYELTGKELEDQLYALKRLVECHSLYVAETYFGICRNLSAMTGNTYATGFRHAVSYMLVSNLAQNWKENSGNWDYPIPCKRNSKGFYPNLWKGEQKELRLSLMRHMIKELEKVESILLVAESFN